MIHLVVLCKLNGDVDDETVDQMVREAQSQLLKITEVLSVRTGRSSDPTCEWPFYYSVDVESRQKLDLFYDDPISIRFVARFVKPNTRSQLELRYELEPGKDVRFS